jgi:hypothetical protein
MNLSSDSFRSLDFEKVVNEDVDENLLVVDISKNGRLEDDDLMTFINAHFINDFTSSSLRNCNNSNTVQESNRKGVRVTWMENSQTGHLIPVARRIVDDLNGNDPDSVDLESNVGVATLIEAQDGVFEQSSPLILKGPKGLSGNHDDVDDRTSLEVDEVISTISTYNNLVMLQRGVFLLFQVDVINFCLDSFIYCFMQPAHCRVFLPVLLFQLCISDRPL